MSSHMTSTPEPVPPDRGAESTDPILQYFSFRHLPPALQLISVDFAKQAVTLMQRRRTPERTVALRKLLEAKDAAVRAALPEKAYTAFDLAAEIADWTTGP